MERCYLREIVCESFKKAESEIPSHSRYALAMHIADKTTLSSKTLERAYDKYVSNKESKYKKIGDASVNLLCEYLGFNNYQEYVKSKNRNIQKKEDVINGSKPINVTKNNKKNLLIKIASIIFIVVAIGYFFSQITGAKIAKCMVWVKMEYQQVDCNTSLQPEYEADIMPFDANKLKNFKKLNVTITTDFFDKVTNKPLVWYIKNNDEIEYFSSPGLHPVTGKTLRAITPYIINKYVPVHTNNKNSFISE
ncbi:MAG: hypothetical protein ABJD66_07475 [Cellulophaga sp.]|uniref:hypothetical protein n=1 Tax=Cellulophaga sp. TaxID=1972202 RepID=UPI003266713D